MNAYEQMIEAMTKAEAVIEGTQMMMVRAGKEYDLCILDFDGALKMLRAALALPRRQCDVGTADEQNSRFDDFCRGEDCKTCPCNVMPRCHMIWAQTPYENKNGGNDDTNG